MKDRIESYPLWVLFVWICVRRFCRTVAFIRCTRIYSGGSELYGSSVESSFLIAFAKRP